MGPAAIYDLDKPQHPSSCQALHCSRLSLGWRGGTSHLLKPDISLIAFPKQPLKQVCCKGCGWKMVTEDNQAITRGLSRHCKVPSGWKSFPNPLRICFWVWSPSGPRRWRFLGGQGHFGKLVLLRHTATHSNNSHFMSWLYHFSALLKDPWLLHNNPRSSPWAQGGRNSLGTECHFPHLSFNTFISD